MQICHFMQPYYEKMKLQYHKTLICECHRFMCFKRRTTATATKKNNNNNPPSHKKKKKQKKRKEEKVK